MQLNTNATFRLHGMEVFNFEMKPKPDDFDGKTLSFDVSAEVRVNQQMKLVVSGITISIRDEQKQPIIASLKIGVGFIVENFDEVIPQIENEQYMVPTDLEVLLRTISISTARGVLFGYLKGTYLNKAVLPIILPMITPTEESER